MEQQNRKPLLGITGQYQRGKSTLLNCLLGGYYAVEGNGLTTTKYNTCYRWGEFTEARVCTGGKTELLPSPHLLFEPNSTLENLDDDATFEVSVWSPLLKSIDILDSPGYGANQRDNGVALQTLSDADFILYVISHKTLDNEADLPFLRSLNKSNTHYSIMFNCFKDQSPDSAPVRAICKEIKARLDSERLSANYVTLSGDHPVYPINLLWAQCALGYLEETAQKRKLKSLMSYFDGNVPSQRDLLALSGFLSFRKMIEAYVEQFFKLPPVEPLLALERATKLWESAMITIFEQTR